MAFQNFESTRGIVKLLLDDSTILSNVLGFFGNTAYKIFNEYDSYDNIAYNGSFGYAYKTDGSPSWLLSDIVTEDVFGDTGYKYKVDLGTRTIGGTLYQALRYQLNTAGTLVTNRVTDFIKKGKISVDFSVVQRASNYSDFPTDINLCVFSMGDSSDTAYQNISVYAQILNGKIEALQFIHPISHLVDDTVVSIANLNLPLDKWYTLDIVWSSEITELGTQNGTPILGPGFAVLLNDEVYLYSNYNPISCFPNASWTGNTNPNEFLVGGIPSSNADSSPDYIFYYKDIEVYYLTTPKTPKPPPDPDKRTYYGNGEINCMLYLPFDDIEIPTAVYDYSINHHPITITESGGVTDVITTSSYRYGGTGSSLYGATGDSFGIEVSPIDSVEWETFFNNTDHVISFAYRLDADSTSYIVAGNSFENNFSVPYYISIGNSPSDITGIPYISVGETTDGYVDILTNNLVLDDTALSSEEWHSCLIKVFQEGSENFIDIAFTYWNPLTIYTSGNFVKYEDKYYMVVPLAEPPVGTLPTNITYWEEIIYYYKTNKHIEVWVDGVHKHTVWATETNPWTILSNSGNWCIGAGSSNYPPPGYGSSLMGYLDEFYVGEESLEQFTLDTTETVTESVGIDDVTFLRTFIELIESISINDGYVLGVISNINVSDIINIDALQTTSAIVSSAISEGFCFIPRLTLDGIEYSAYCMNPEIFAVTQYTNYNYNSFAVFNNRHLAASTSGLYLLEGTTDDDEYIVPKMLTAAMDFGTSNLKQVPQVYLGIDQDNTIILKVNVDDQSTSYYSLTATCNRLGTQRIKCGKGLIGRYFQFELQAKDCETFKLDNFEFYPVVLRRKI